MQMLYCFVNNIHVDYAELLWEGFHYSLKNPTTMIPYPRFIKLIVSHYMTIFPGISRRARDRYHNLEDDVMIKSIFNSRKSKNVVGMKIPDWMITDEMKLTKNYRLYTEDTYPEIIEGESSAQRRSTIIRLCIPLRRSTRLTSPTPIPTTDEADDLVLQDTIQVSLAEHKSHEELESKQNVETVKEHLMAKEIEKLVEGSENIKVNVEVASSSFRNDDNQTHLGTRLEPRSDKESPEVENINEISELVNIIEEEEESADDDYELKRREKGKHVEEIRNTPSPTTIRYPRIQSTLVSSNTEKLQELTKTDPTPSSSTPSSSSPKTSSLPQTDSYLYLNPSLDVSDDTRASFKNYKEAMGIILEREKIQAEVAKMIVDAIQQECENLRSKISLQVNDAITNHIPSQVDSSVRSYMSGHKTYEHGMFIFRESSSGQYYESEPDDDVLSDEKVSQDLMDKMHKLLMKLSYVKLLMKC
nr:hypothetical protein [Tanacetum cinerariifolium]